MINSYNYITTKDNIHIDQQYVDVVGWVSSGNENIILVVDEIPTKPKMKNLIVSHSNEKYAERKSGKTN